jgi:hypothetical protein
MKGSRAQLDGLREFTGALSELLMQRDGTFGLRSGLYFPIIGSLRKKRFFSHLQYALGAALLAKKTVPQGGR